MHNPLWQSGKSIRQSKPSLEWYPLVSRMPVVIPAIVLNGYRAFSILPRLLAASTALFVLYRCVAPGQRALWKKSYQLGFCVTPCDSACYVLHRALKIAHIKWVVWIQDPSLGIPAPKSFTQHPRGCNRPECQRPVHGCVINLRRFLRPGQPSVCLFPVVWRLL